MSCRCQYIKSSSKTNLGSLKAHVDKLDVDKLETLSVNLNKLSHVVDNNVFKKLCMTTLLQQPILLIPRYQVIVKYFPKGNVIWKRCILQKKLKVLIRRYLMLVCSQKN